MKQIFYSNPLHVEHSAHSPNGCAGCFLILHFLCVLGELVMRCEEKLVLQFSLLPHMQSGKISWKHSVGCFIPFTYNDSSGKIAILDYHNGKVLLEYKGNKIWHITGNLLKGYVRKLITTTVDGFKYSIGTTFCDSQRNLNIIAYEYRKHHLQDYKHKNEHLKWYNYKCNICGYEGWMIESALKSGQGCSCCASRTVVKGINDIPTTAPWMIPYFQNGMLEAEKYTKKSGKSIYPRCPHCGRIHYKLVPIRNLFSNGFLCTCSDGISYNEKFMIALLDILNIDYIWQLSKKDFKWCNNRRYDFYISQSKTIIEMNGAQHYKDTSWGKYSDIAIIDNEKKRIALENGILHYVEINCSIGNLDYIKNSIISSNLPSILDINITDDLLNDCHKKALTSNLLSSICKIKNDHPKITVREINYLYPQLSINCIYNYVRKGIEIGLCPNINVKNVWGKASKDYYTYYNKSVCVFSSKGQFLGKFSNINELSHKSIELFDTKFLGNKIRRVCDGDVKTYLNYHFEYGD